MDPSVLESIKRWPDVPAVAGWLSLDRHGRWRLHPQGDAEAGGPGEQISNERILDFINRNYAHDAEGRWFFQNGPQRVYARLDAAPYILRVAGDGIGLETHTRRQVRSVTAWWLDDTGRIYAQTDAGPGMIEGRDLPQVLDAMHAADGSTALDRAADLPAGATIQVRHAVSPNGAPLGRIAQDDIAGVLGFAR